MRLIILLSIAILVLLGFSIWKANSKVPVEVEPAQEVIQPKPQETKQMKQYEAQPQLNLKPNTDYKAIIKTSKGDIKIDLFETQTPITVNNFVFLAQDGFYDNVIFHRIISGFMIQSGDPQGNGTGGPGYRFDDEEFDEEYTAGTIAMANSGPNTNGSQFFIMHKDYPLPKNYTIFGRAEDAESLAVIDEIANTKVTRSPSGEMSMPVEEVQIVNVEVLEN